MISNSILSALPAATKMWAKNPPLAVRQLFGVTPDPWQDCCLEDFSILNYPEHRRQSMVACKNPGKTAVLAWESLLFILTRPLSLVLAVSITGDNLRDNYWTEMARWMARSPVIKKYFTWHAEHITCNLAPDRWYATARTYQKTADKETLRAVLSGTHADRQMYILDETGSMSPEVLSTAEIGLGGGIERRIVMAGNCTSRQGALYHACVKHRDLYTVYHITGDPDKKGLCDKKNRKFYAPRVDIDLNRKMIADEGRDNPWVKVDILGEWPEQDINVLISEEEVLAAQERDQPESAFSWCEKKLGVDVAFEGGDLTVLAPRQGLMCMEPVVMSVVPSRPDFCEQIAGRVLKVYGNFKFDREIVDCTGGFGQGVVSNLVAAGHTPFRYIGSAEAPDPQFANMATQCWWDFIDAIKHGLCLPRHPEFVRTLPARTYSSLRGRFIMEPKKDFKARVLGGKSPNVTDAYAMTYAVPDRPAEDQLKKYLQQRREKEHFKYDPYHRIKKRKR